MNTTLVSTLWLAILRAQRPIPYAEVASALPELSHGQRTPLLNVAYRLGYLERTGKRRSYEYSVTPRCRIPPGVQVCEILEATA